MTHNIPTTGIANYIPSNRSGTVRKFFKSALWIVIVLVGFEIVFRFFISGLTPLSNFDPDLGPRPVDGSVILYNKEGNGVIHYVKDGEIASPVRGGVNIPVFGDSQTASFQVNDYQNYVSIAETSLRDKGIKVDLRNMGYPAGTLADYTYWASLAKTKFNAGIVVIQISTNDFFGSGGSEGYILSAVGNYFKRNDDGTLTLIHQPIEDRYAQFKPFIAKSAFLGYTVDRLRLYREIIKMDDRTRETANKLTLTSGSTSDTNNIVANYNAQLSMLHEAYRGERVILLLLPSSPAISGDRMELENSEYSRLLEQARKFKGWEIIDPLPAFQALWLEEQKLPRGFTNSEPGIGHLNVDGHAIVGQLLAEKIEEMMK